jgi:hypothetical protein
MSHFSAKNTKKERKVFPYFQKEPSVALEASPSSLIYPVFTQIK